MIYLVFSAHFFGPCPVCALVRVKKKNNEEVVPIASSTKGERVRSQARHNNFIVDFYYPSNINGNINEIVS